jgi:hypothetical protein
MILHLGIAHPRRLGAITFALFLSLCAGAPPARADEIRKLPAPADPLPEPRTTPSSEPTPMPTASAPPALDVAAEDGTPVPTHRKHNSLALSLDVSRFDYKEDFPPPGKSTENGTLPGLFVLYRQQESFTSNYWSFTFEFSPGGTHYDGTTQAPEFNPVQQETSNRFFRAEADYGINLTCLSRDTNPGCVKLYFGLGARLWTRGESTITGNVASPAEDYSWLYLPLGVRYEKQWDDNWSFALDASLRWTFLGNIVVRFTDLGLADNDGEGSLGSKLGERLELSVRRKVSDTLSFEVVPWFEYSAIGQGSIFDIYVNGELKDQGLEPASRTYQYGARLGFVYAY